MRCMRSRVRPSLHRAFFRAGCYAATPVIMFLALRLFWGWEAQRRLDAVKRELAAEGIPLEYHPPDASAPDNPAPLLLAAARSVRLTSAEWDLALSGDDPDGPLDWNAAHRIEMRAVIDGQKPAFDELDEALQRTGTAVFPDRGAGLREVFQFAKLVRGDAVLLYREGHHAAALRRINQLADISRIAEGYHSEVGHLVAVATSAMATQELEDMTAGLRLDEGDGSVAEAKKFLEDREDPQKLLENGELAIEADLAFLPSDVEKHAPLLRAWWVHPHLIESTANDMQTYGRLVNSYRADNWPEFFSRWVSVPRRHPQSARLDELAGNELWEPASEYGLMEFRCIADWEGATIPLAAEVYKSEHGQYPTSAAELVPEFFAKVPIDPFSRDHSPMHYRLDLGGPTVWSVGENGTDEGAKIALGTSGSPLRRYGRPPDAQPDMVYGAAWRTTNVASPSPPASSGPAPPEALTRSRTGSQSPHTRPATGIQTPPHKPAAVGTAPNA